MIPANRGILLATTAVILFLAVVLFLINKPGREIVPTPEPAPVPAYLLLTSEAGGFQMLPAGLQFALAAAVVKGELPQEALQITGGAATYRLNSPESDPRLLEVAAHAAGVLSTDLAVVSINVNDVYFRRLLVYRPDTLDDRIEKVLVGLAPKRLGGMTGFEYRILIGN